MKLTTKQIKSRLQDILLYSDTLSILIDHAIVTEKAAPLLFSVISRFIAQMAVISTELQDITITINLK